MHKKMDSNMTSTFCCLNCIVGPSLVLFWKEYVRKSKTMMLILLDGFILKVVRHW